ncbi:MAG: Rieske (2Fe-2S) protein [Halolamina sp.]
MSDDGRARDDQGDDEGGNVNSEATVLGVERGGDAVGFSRPVVEAEGGVVTATVGGTDVLVVAAEEDLYAYRDPGQDWELTRGGLRGEGALWDPATGRPLDNPATHIYADQEPLERLSVRRLSALDWRDEHGDASLYRR